jgi:hypothetical protein
VASESLDDLDDTGTLVLEQRFAIVPEWVIDVEISDCAYRLYSVLLRYGQSSGRRMPGRSRRGTRTDGPDWRDGAEQPTWSAPVLAWRRVDGGSALLP